MKPAAVQFKYLDVEFVTAVFEIAAKSYSAFPRSPRPSNAHHTITRVGWPDA
jgi:hypothetical protein